MFLWLLAIVIPLVSLFMFWGWRVKQRLISQFVQSRLLAVLTVGVSQGRQKFKLVLLVMAVAFCLLALARPQWGYAWEEAHQRGLDIVVAVDTSRSMLAEDAVPNRLARAKMAALDLMKLAKNDRLGLVSFAGTAFLQAPLTLDEEAFRQNLEALDVGIIPEGGTAIGGAIDCALEAFEKGSDNHKVLVLFTDGEDHDADGEAVAAAKRAAKEGLIIFTIGVGTPQGELLRVKNDQGDMVFLKDEDDNAVKSRLNESLLQQIATETHGFYLPLLGANPIDTLYSQGLAPLPKSDGASMLTKVYRERFYWPLGLAMVCLMLEIFVPERRTSRRSSGSAVEGAAKAAAVVALLLLPQAVLASSSSALRQFNAGKFEPSFQEYQRLAEKHTNDYRLSYNAGTAAYQAKDYASAQQFLTNALNAPGIASDLKAQQHAYYNLGNTQYKLGEGLEDPEKQIGLWGQAVTNYDHSLKLNPADTNATRNLQYVKKRLEELKKQQQQKQQQQNKDDKDNKDQKDQKDQQNQDKQNDKKQDKQDQKDQKDSKNQKDQKDKQNQQQQSKKDQQNSKDQQKKDSQQSKDQQKQQQAKKDKKDKEDKKDQASEADKKAGDDKNAAQQAMAQAGKMTPMEAKKILDEDLQNEKALIFTPAKEAGKANPSKHKDW
jgi:Ca-activated chloride channel family protein